MKLLRLFTIIIMMMITSFVFTGCDKPEPSEAIAGFSYLGVYPEWLTAPPPHNLDSYDSISDDASKAAYLFRQASYNEIDMGQYVYFLDGGGGTALSGATLEVRAQTIHIHNGDDSFHQMINILTDAGNLGTLEDTVKSFVSRAYQRTYYDGNRYYRKGSNQSLNEDDILIAAWGNYDITPTGSPTTRADYASEEEYLNSRYTTKTFLDFGKYTDSIEQLNSDNLVLSEGTSIEIKYDNDNNKYYSVVMQIDIAVANNNAATMEALKKDTDTYTVSYSEFTIEFEVWENGLFKSLNPIEGWTGVIKKSLLTFNGSSTSSNPRLYSYHPDDCDMSEVIALLPINN